MLTATKAVSDQETVVNQLLRAEKTACTPIVDETTAPGSTVTVTVPSSGTASTSTGGSTDSSTPGNVTATTTATDTTTAAETTTATTTATETTTQTSTVTTTQTTQATSATTSTPDANGAAYVVQLTPDAVAAVDRVVGGDTSVAAVDAAYQLVAETTGTSADSTTGSTTGPSTDATAPSSAAGRDTGASSVVRWHPDAPNQHGFDRNHSDDGGRFRPVDPAHRLPGRHRRRAAGSV